jgi:hypothetical protein
MEITSELFTFPFKDPNWKSKALIGMVIGLAGMIFFPILWLIPGYSAEVLRRTLRTGEPSLPEWGDWSKLITDGLWYIAVTLVYNAPVLVVYFIYAAVITGLLMTSPVLLTADFSEAAQSAAMAGTFTTIGLLSACMGAVALLALPLQMLELVALARAIDQDRLGAAFEFREVWQLFKAGLGNFLIAFLVWYGVTLGLSVAISLVFYTIIFCFLYPFLYGVMLTYSAVMAGVLVAKAYRATQGKIQAAGDGPSPAGAEAGAV